jgi:glutamyl-tRNA reductase
LFFAEDFSPENSPEAIYDIAVPRNVCPDVSVQHPAIALFDVDSLGTAGALMDPHREAQLRQEALAIVKQALEHLPRCLNKVACKQELTRFRDFVEQLHRDYLSEHPLSLNPEASPEAHQAQLEEWSMGLVQRILHSPSHVINEGLYNASQLSLLNELFTPLSFSRDPLADLPPAVDTSLIRETLQRRESP